MLFHVSIFEMLFSTLCVSLSLFRTLFEEKKNAILIEHRKRHFGYGFDQCSVIISLYAIRKEIKTTKNIDWGKKSPMKRRTKREK